MRDPDEAIPEGDAALAMLTSQQGSVCKKWWESATIVVPTSSDLYYTSESATELRWSSPGQFVLYADGKANQDGALTVYMEFDVTLSQPSYESSTGKKGSIYNFLADCSVEGGVGNNYLVLDNNKTTPSSILPYAVEGSVYETEARSYGRNKDNAMDGVVNFKYLRVQGGKVWTASPNGTPLTEHAFERTRVFWKDDKTVYRQTVKLLGETPVSLCHCRTVIVEPESSVRSSFERLSVSLPNLEV